MSDDPLFQKEIRFFKINPFKSHEIKRTFIKEKQLKATESEKHRRRFYDTIEDVLKDFQYFSGYRKEQMNLTEGERVLKMNGIKVIKQNDTYFIEKYISRQQNILQKKPIQLGSQQKAETLKVQYNRTETLTDPKYFLSMLGYTSKEKDYYQYLDLQCYKCPAYGIEIVIYQKWYESQYMMIEAVNNFQGINPVFVVLLDRLKEFVTEEPYNQIDQYTLRPKTLRNRAETWLEAMIH